MKRYPIYVLGAVMAVASLGCGAGAATDSDPTPADVPVSSRPTSPTPTAAAVAPSPAAKKKAGPVTQIGDGTWRVGVDVAAGQYRTAGSTNDYPCYWARLKNANGDIDSVITNGLPQGPSVVNIKASDELFETKGCRTWVRVG